MQVQKQILEALADLKSYADENGLEQLKIAIANAEMAATTDFADAPNRSVENSNPSVGH
ncbi:MAG: hypothetical protein AB8C02_14670 [Halioglobus sp.]